jgi:hypothetical protein
MGVTTASSVEGECGIPTVTAGVVWAGGECVQVCGPSRRGGDSGGCSSCTAVDSRGCLSPSCTAAVVTQLDQVMAPGAQVDVGPRAAYAVRGAVVHIGGGYRGGDPHISPLWQALGTLRGSSHHCNVTRKRAEGVCGVVA